MKVKSSKDQLQDELYESDIICVGGGIAGLMAAIRASELGAKVIVADKVGIHFVIEAVQQ